jgi:hypothetical protein
LVERLAIISGSVRAVDPLAVGVIERADLIERGMRCLAILGT